MNNVLRGALVSMVAVASLLTAPAALAAPNDNTCDFGEGCIFLNSNYGGGMDDVSSTDGNWLNNNYSSGPSVHDSASSGFGMERAMRFWVNVNFSGAYFTLGLNQYDPLWTTNQPNAVSATIDFNDRVDANALFVP